MIIKIKSIIENFRELENRFNENPTKKNFHDLERFANIEVVVVENVRQIIREPKEALKWL